MVYLFIDKMHKIAQPQLGTEFTRWESCDFLGVSVEDFGGDWVVQLLRLAFGLGDDFSATSSGYRPDRVLYRCIHCISLHI